eukprot:1856115-Lingulodinium_polyedra.AAC.1
MPGGRCCGVAYGAAGPCRTGFVRSCARVLGMGLAVVCACPLHLIPGRAGASFDAVAVRLGIPVVPAREAWLVLELSGVRPIFD